MKSPKVKVVSTAKKVNRFVDFNLKQLNKTEAEKQEESLVEFVENAKIDCAQQIGTIKTAELPKLQLELQKAENNLRKAEESYEKSRFTVASSFESYVRNRESCLDNIDYANDTVNEVKQKIIKTEKQLSIFEDMLNDLN